MLGCFRFLSWSFLILVYASLSIPSFLSINLPLTHLLTHSLSLCSSLFSYISIPTLFNLWFIFVLVSHYQAQALSCHFLSTVWKPHSFSYDSPSLIKHNLSLCLGSYSSFSLFTLLLFLFSVVIPCFNRKKTESLSPFLLLAFIYLFLSLSTPLLPHCCGPPCHTIALRGDNRPRSDPSGLQRGAESSRPHL